MYQKKTKEAVNCPLEYALSLFGCKWNARIICVLYAFPSLRYSEIRRHMVNITDAVLATSLKQLLSHELIERTAFDEIPPRVEYRLSERGKTVIPILQNICAWARMSHKGEGCAVSSGRCSHCDYEAR